MLARKFFIFYVIVIALTQAPANGTKRERVTIAFTCKTLHGMNKWKTWSMPICRGGMDESLRQALRHLTLVGKLLPFERLTSSVSLCVHVCRHTFLMSQLSDLSTLSLACAADNKGPNIALVSRGYLGTAPLHPNTAITFRALEAYRQLHRVCPKLSIYAQVQALCHLHHV